VLCLAIVLRRVRGSMRPASSVGWEGNEEDENDCVRFFFDCVRFVFDCVRFSMQRPSWGAAKAFRWCREGLPVFFAGTRGIRLSVGWEDEGRGFYGLTSQMECLFSVDVSNCKRKFCFSFQYDSLLSVRRDKM
jgi:hypothetical protein